MPNRDNTCPVCGQETEDMRHVDVECFYKVNERAPHLKESTHFRQVPTDDYLGHMRRYNGGEGRKYRREQVTPNHVKLHSYWEPLAEPDITLLETTVYGTRCCKSCRADFISLFVRWSKGEFAPKPEADDPERDIPVRVNGAIQMLTRAEWDAMHPDREPMTWGPE